VRTNGAGPLPPRLGEHPRRAGSDDVSKAKGGEAGLRGRASANFIPEVRLQTRIRSSHTSLSLVSRLVAQSFSRVLRSLCQRGATPLSFSSNYPTFLYRPVQ